MRGLFARRIIVERDMFRGVSLVGSRSCGFGGDVEWIGPFVGTDNVTRGRVDWADVQRPLMKWCSSSDCRAGWGARDLVLGSEWRGGISSVFAGGDGGRGGNAPLD